MKSGRNARVAVLVLVLTTALTFALDNPENDDLPDLDVKNGTEKKLSDQIMLILEHYQQEDPMGIPGAPVPDPMPIPPMKQSFSVATMNFKDVLLHGLTKFRMENMLSNIANMEVQIQLKIDVLLVNGNYTMVTWWSRSAGPFQVTLKNVTITGVGHMAVQSNGRLILEDIKMDVKFRNIGMNFENLGLTGSIFQGIINSVGTFLFDSIKPFILKQANRDIRGDMNKQIEKIPYTFPNSISPFDMAIAQVRKYVRDRGFDPYYVKDYNYSAGLFDIHLTHTWLTGLSGFYRNGNITLRVHNGTTHSFVDVGTTQLFGTSQWDVSLIGGVISRAGTVSFSVEYIKAQASISQPIDTRKHSRIDDLQLTLGNIQIRCDGLGTIDYAVEFLVNILPNLLRYQIMDAIESPIKAKIQLELNKVTIDRLLREKAFLIDEFQQKGFDFDPFAAGSDSTRVVSGQEKAEL